MCGTQELDRSDGQSTEGGHFAWKGLILLMLAVPVSGLLLAWAGHVAQTYFAPLILFPVLLGISAGIAIVAFVRFAQIGNRPTIILAAVLAAAVAAAGQHYFNYLATYHWRRPAVDAGLPVGQEDLSAILREMVPSFGDFMLLNANQGRPLFPGYMAHGWVAWLSWTIDALLVVAAAAAVTVPATRVPFCNRCRSWYRTIRGGRIDVLTARRLAELVGVQEVNHPRSARYRLSSCQGGCGPTRLELSWEEANGAVDLARVWLDPATRNQVAAILDGLADGDAEATNDEE